MRAFNALTLRLQEKRYLRAFANAWKDTEFQEAVLSAIREALQDSLLKTPGESQPELFVDYWIEWTLRSTIFRPFPQSHYFRFSFSNGLIGQGWSLLASVGIELIPAPDQPPLKHEIGPK